MSHDDEYTVVYGDIVALYVFYWPLHQNLPECAQCTTGSTIISEMTRTLRAVVSINREGQGCRVSSDTHALLVEVITSLAVIKALLTQCRQLMWITPGSLAVLTTHISKITHCVTGWQQRLIEQNVIPLSELPRLPSARHSLNIAVGPDNSI
ncbi:hypothetical protein [Aeromonas sp. R2-2]|uniref:hypothetical protein n=1 Tax=Aeromonas sp. R2-2 TaxID=3138460 RepID=UPI0034A324CE